MPRTASSASPPSCSSFCAHVRRVLSAGLLRDAHRRREVVSPAGVRDRRVRRAADGDHRRGGAGAAGVGPGVEVHVPHGARGQGEPVDAARRATGGAAGGGAEHEQAHLALILVRSSMSIFITSFRSFFHHRYCNELAQHEMELVDKLKQKSSAKKSKAVDVIQGSSRRACE